MFQYFSSATEKMMEAFQDMGFFDRDEMRKYDAKYVPGLELNLTSEKNFEIGILYKLMYGEIGTRFMCNSNNPIAKLNSSWRVAGNIARSELTSTGAIDVRRLELAEWDVGLAVIGGNFAGQLKLEASRCMLTTRHRIHPRLVVLGENKLIYGHKRSAFAVGFEFDFTPRTTLEVMVPQLLAPSFALQHRFSYGVVRVSTDLYSFKPSVSIAFRPCSLFSC